MWRARVSSMGPSTPRAGSGKCSPASVARPVAFATASGRKSYFTHDAAPSGASKAERHRQALTRYRLPERLAPELALHDAPAWLYLHGLKSPLSSTALRAIRKDA